jgi:hypothetical protein
VHATTESNAIELDDIPVSRQWRKVVDESGHDTYGLHEAMILSFSDRFSWSSNLPRNSANAIKNTSGHFLHSAK